MKIGKDYIGVGVGAVIVNDSGEILLLKRMKDPEKGYWSIPGGTVEFGETIEETIIREVFEEIGVTIEIITLLGITNHIIPNEGVHWVAPAFLVKITHGGIPENKEPQSHEKMNWFPINKIPVESTITTKSALSKYHNFLLEKK
jgi:8-oxo-dGTP diphosphatase